MTFSSWRLLCRIVSGLVIEVTFSSTCLYHFDKLLRNTLINGAKPESDSGEGSLAGPGFR